MVDDVLQRFELYYTHGMGQEIESTTKNCRDIISAFPKAFLVFSPQCTERLSCLTTRIPIYLLPCASYPVKLIFTLVFLFYSPLFFRDSSLNNAFNEFFIIA